MEWYPKYDNSVSGVSLSPTSGTTEAPKVELPMIGDTIKLLIHPWGHIEVLTPHTGVNAGANIVEVEVKTLLKAKTVFE